MFKVPFFIKAPFQVPFQVRFKAHFVEAPFKDVKRAQVSFLYVFIS